MHYGGRSSTPRGVAGRVRQHLHEAERGLIESREFYGLWALALLGYGVGDVWTTLALVYAVPHVDEGNAVMGGVMAEYGPAGLVALKLLALFVAIGIAVWSARERDRLLYYAPPAMLAVLGAFATTWNLRLMLG